MVPESEASQGLGRNASQTAELTLEQIQYIFCCEAIKKNWRAQRKGQTATFCWWGITTHAYQSSELHSFKDLQNDKTFLGGMYQLTHCSRIPKIGSWNTRSSTSVIVKRLKFSPQNCKKASPTIKMADIYLTSHPCKTGFPTSALLAASVVKTWKLQEKKH